MRETRGFDRIMLNENGRAKEKCDKIRSIPPGFEGFYKTVDGVGLPIKIFYPKRKKRCGVAFLIIHGGAWHAVKNNLGTWNGGNMQFQAQYYADMGFPACTVSYRDIEFTEQTTAFDLIEDCKDAISYMRGLIDFEKLVILGESAGGHIAVMLGMDDEVSADAVVALNPVLDVVNKWSYVAKNDSDRFKLSPAFNAKVSRSKYLIMHGTADTDVDFRISCKFSSDMARLGADCEYIGIEGERHSFIIYGYRSEEVKILEYMAMIDNYLFNSGITDVAPRRKRKFPLEDIK